MPKCEAERDGEALAASILTRRKRKCIAAGNHVAGKPPDTPESAICPRRGT